ncbi:ATP-binding protein [Janthinobacterium fluminis]|uniref:histidine kinase n=1 Tax=Janthinobacterium fluminis TaxID=2987524 RepID=A0ABT5JZA2_9BURK|nr:ATP-binding protein [Janthinobacterium fluminis]MDC8758060.1 ATP-binding protein [Janthinobacterium fluminis]
MSMPAVARRSLYRRLMWVSLASIMLVWSLLLAWFYIEVTQVGSGYFDRDLRGLGDTIADMYSVDFPEPARARLIERQILQFSRSYSESALREREITYRISNRAGQVLGQSPGWPMLAIQLPGAAPVNDRGWRSLATASEDGNVYVQLCVARSFVQRAVAEILVFFLLPLVAAMPIFIVLLQLGFGRALTPLRRLAGAISERDPYSDQPLACNDVAYRELKPLFNSVNDLLARLAVHRESEQRLFADAAHELRTPLAALGAQVHLLQQAESAPERAGIAALLHESIARHAGLVSKLLLLSRLDAESTKTPPQALDLARLARAAVARHAPHAVARGIELAYDGTAAAAPYRGDPAALDSLLDNLVDNAIRHCPPGAAISVEVVEGRHFARISVCDDGPGIAPAWREDVLKRFVRLPDATATGSGLGLAIVKKVVELHGGTLLFSDGMSGRGLGVEIRLPHALQGGAV